MLQTEMLQREQLMGGTSSFDFFMICISDVMM